MEHRLRHSQCRFSLGRASSTYGIDEDQRDTGKASYETDELVQISGTSPGNAGTDSYHEETEEVLLPLDIWVVLAGPAEELLTGNLDSGVDL
jgi:hypothetical protein